jgi:hypothetical protein
VIISLVAAALIWLFAYNDIKAVTRSLLGFEAISVALVTILIIVIYAKVIGGSAPNGQDFTLKPFVPQRESGSARSRSRRSSASSPSVLRRGRFARRGDQQPAPQRAARDRSRGRLLRHLLHARHVRSVAGLRIDQAGIDAFAGSSAPLDDLSKSYVGDGMADAINLARC